MIPIAGDLKIHGGGNLDPQWTLLSNSPSHADSEKEGLRLEIGGGPKHARQDDSKKRQKAIIEFLCDRNRTGLEGEMRNPYYEKRAEAVEGDEKNDESDDRDGEDTSPAEPSLKFLKYDTTGTEYDILRLEWTTKYACVGEKDENGGKGNDDGNGESASWGFFTWFILM